MSDMLTKKGYGKALHALWSVLEAVDEEHLKIVQIWPKYDKLPLTWW